MCFCSCIVSRGTTTAATVVLYALLLHYTTAAAGALGCFPFCPDVIGLLAVDPHIILFREQHERS